MSFRPLPAGQEGKITWGHLGNRRSYVNKSFKSVPDLTTEERVKELEKLMKPYNSNDYIGRAFEVGGTEKGTTPPAETYYILAESGDALTAENGDNLITEQI